MAFRLTVVAKGYYLKSYSQYVNHYQTVVQLLAGQKNNSELQVLLEGLKASKTGKGIKDFLIMPIQRIPRYQMLIKVCQDTMEQPNGVLPSVSA